jgi:hypothetical protein
MLRISSGAQYVTLQKYFSHPSLAIYFFPNHTHKTKARTPNKWETTKVIATHLDQSNYVANYPHVLAFDVPCTTASSAGTKMLGQNQFVDPRPSQFADPNQHVFTFLLPIFFGRDTY